VSKILPIFIATFALCFCNVVTADSITQTDTLSTDNSGELFSETQGNTTNFPLFNEQFFSLTAAPFDPSLGTLESFTVSFSDIAISGNGTVANLFGSVGTGLSGQFSLGGFGFGGAGNNAFEIVETPGDPIEFETSVDFSQTFFVADDGLPFGDPALVGTAFNPAILDTVEGSTPFQILFNSSGQIGVNDVTDVFAQASGTISIQYHFTPTSVPEPSSTVIAMLALGTLFTRRRRA